MGLQDRDYWKERHGKPRRRPQHNPAARKTDALKKLAYFRQAEKKRNAPRLLLALGLVTVVWLAVAGKLLNLH